MTASALSKRIAGDSGSDGSWAYLHDDLIAGIVHAMNNCVTVLGVSLEVSATDGIQSEAAVLRRELTQLETLIGFTSALSSRSTRDDALELSEVLQLALTIHALNPVTRTVRCTMESASFVSPVRVSRSLLLRALLLMIDGAKRANAGGAGGPVAIEVAGDDERVMVRAATGHPLSSDLETLASACGGSLAVEEGRALFALPSLASLRRANRPQ